MMIPATLVVAFVSVLAGSLILASSLANSNIFQTATHTSSQPQEAEAASLPLSIDEKFKSKEMAGDSSGLKVMDDFIDPEHHCEFCTRIEYIPGHEGVAGFAYTGTSGLDLTAAKKVRFWVMGQDGGEKIKFDIAGKSLDAIKGNAASKFSTGLFKNQRFALSTAEIKLDKDWKKYEVDLKGADLKGITHPFGFEISKGSTSKKQVIYIKGIIYDTEPAQNPITAIQADMAKPLVAKIISNATKGVAPATIELEANMSGGKEPYSIRWNFGDNDKENNNTRNAIHIFRKAGEYNVTLSVADALSQNASDNLAIQILNAEKQAPRANVSDGNAVTEKSTTANETGDQDARLLAGAGVDSVVKPRDIVILGGKVTGMDPNKTSYAWTQTSDPKVEIGRADSINSTVTIPADIESDFRAQFQLTATHGSAQAKAR
jgi:hypothetical protein